MLLWGLKTEAAFDVWSIEHLMMGINLGYFVNFIMEKWNIPKSTTKKPLIIISFLLVLTIAFSWENLEHYIELGLFGQSIAYWFQGVEHWSNRLIFETGAGKR